MDTNAVTLKAINSNPSVTTLVLPVLYPLFYFYDFSLFIFFLKYTKVINSSIVLFKSPNSYMVSDFLRTHVESLAKKKLYENPFYSLLGSVPRLDTDEKDDGDSEYNNYYFLRQNRIFNTFFRNNVGYPRKLKLIKELKYKKLLDVHIRVKKTQRYLNTLLSNFNLSHNVSLISNNYISTYKYLQIWSWANKLLKQYSFLKKTRTCAMLVSSLLTCLRFKDTKPLTSVLKDIFEHVHYSKHKQYFYMVSFLIKSICFSKKRFFGVKGMKVYFGGKLGVGGNAKKRRKHIKFGKCSNTTKKLRVDYSSDFVRTATGVFGFSISLYY